MWNKNKTEADASFNVHARVETDEMSYSGYLNENPLSKSEADELFNSYHTSNFHVVNIRLYCDGRDIIIPAACLARCFVTIEIKKV